MTFWSDEKSLAGGVPYELHEFRARGTSTYWRYADAPADVSYGGNTFRAVYIEGKEIEQGENALRNQTSVLVDWACPFAWQYTIAAPEQVIDYTRYKLQGANAIINFIGVVVAVRFRQSDREGKRHAEIFIDPAANDLQDSGLVHRSGRQCQVFLYTTDCGVSRAAWRVSGVIATVNGVTITSTLFSGYPGNWFVGGDLVTANQSINGLARRKIIYHVGNTIKISRSVYGMAVGDVFDAYPGCDHTCPTCDTKFDNLLNCKAEPLIPDGDPWGDMI